MKRYEQGIMICAVLWLSACSTLPRPVTEPDDEVRQQARRQAAVKTRWIGVTRFWSNGCPDPGIPDWKARPLVPLNRLEPGLARSARKARLNRFCVYEYKGSDPITADLPREISDRLRSFEPDLVALSSMATLQELTPVPFSKRFFEQVQVPADLPAASTSRVRLTFLDTQPTGEGIPQQSNPNAPLRSPHGYTLGHIAGHLAGYPTCGGASCAVEVASRLALPLVSFEPGPGVEERDQEGRGGFRGTFLDLYQAIMDEIDDWKATPEGNRPRLVLNLSIGWDGEKFGGWEEELDHLTPGPWLVHGALQTAVKEGVLVIAAAGNERGGPNPTGQPLLPGGWEKPLRLSKHTNQWIWKDLGEPLIYAASGVDGFGRQLVNTRQKGEAPVVAYADHVVVPDLHKPGQHTVTLTGTSVATAVTSTIAAMVWSYRPGLTPAKVMNILYESGTSPMGRHHDFAPSANAEVRQITLCKALAHALLEIETPPLECGAIPKPAPIDLSGFTGDPAGLIEPPLISFRPHPDPQDRPVICPQPGVNPCPNCVVDPPRLAQRAALDEIALAANRSPLSETTPDTNLPYTLLVELPRPEWGVLKNATLEIFGFDIQGRRTATPLSRSSIDTTLPPEGPAQVVAFPLSNTPFQAATLSFTLAPSSDAREETFMSVVSPLLIDSPDAPEIPQLPEILNSVTK